MYMLHIIYVVYIQILTWFVISVWRAGASLTLQNPVPPASLPSPLRNQAVFQFQRVLLLDKAHGHQRPSRLAPLCVAAWQHCLVLDKAHVHQRPSLLAPLCVAAWQHCLVLDKAHVHQRPSLLAPLCVAAWQHCLVLDKAPVCLLGLQHGPLA